MEALVTFRFFDVIRTPRFGNGLETAHTSKGSYRMLRGKYDTEPEMLKLDVNFRRL